MYLSSEEITQAARAVMPGGVNSATRDIGEAIAFRSAHGSRMVDFEGRSFIDYHAAFGAILLGHTDERVNAAVSQAIGTIDLVGVGATELEVEVARLVVESIPSAEMTISTLTGSEAVMQAIRLSRGATKRDYVIKFQGCFHGSFDAIARNVISSPEKAFGLDPLSSGILPDALGHTLIAEFNDLASVQELFDAYPDQIAAVILEPIPHNVGAVLPEIEFLEGLRALTSESGTVLIFDEVITGFRHSLGGYQEIVGVTPDLTTFGKAMANGYPIAGLAGSRDLMSNFTPMGGSVMLAGTYNGGSASMAAAIATITALKDPELGFYDHVYRLGDRMREGLRRILGDLDVAATVTGQGSVFVTYFGEGPIRNYRDVQRNNHVAYEAFQRGMIPTGNFFYPMSLKRNHISYAHTEADIDMTLNAAEQVLGDLARRGVLTSAAVETGR